MSVGYLLRPALGCVPERLVGMCHLWTLDQLCIAGLTCHPGARDRDREARHDLGHFFR